MFLLSFSDPFPDPLFSRKCFIPGSFRFVRRLGCTLHVSHLHSAGQEQSQTRQHFRADFQGDFCEFCIIKKTTIKNVKNTDTFKVFFIEQELVFVLIFYVLRICSTF